MTSQRYRIVLNGAVAKGHDVAAVKRNLASLFKTDAMTIDRVFSGRRAVIKQGLDAEQALQYVSALAQAGAVGRMEAMPADAGTSAAERRERQRRKARNRRTRVRQASLAADRRHSKGRRAVESA